MAVIGEIQKASQIGKVGGNSFIWHACSSCGKERWVRLCNGSPISLKGGIPHEPLCRSCNLKRRITIKTNYVHVRLQPTDFFYPMVAQNGYVLEHRLVMAKHLGRCLHRWEIVHHKKGVAKDDNRIEGLQLVTDDRHNQITILEMKITNLEKRVTILEAENIRLLNALELTEWK
jgi:hypothetical protein